MILTLHQLDGGAGAKIGAADAHDHKDVGVLANPLGCCHDAAHLLGGLKNGQVLPAQEVGAGAFALSQHPVRGKNLFLQAEQII